MKLYRLRKPEHPWGDYGSILIHGMSMHLRPTRHGSPQLERTGPFVPPVTFPGVWDIIVTDQFRQALEDSGLTGCEFSPVRKARIVSLRWEKWDRTAEHPAQRPNDGEPESYILARPHSPAISKKIGRLWKLTGSSWGSFVQHPLTLKPGKRRPRDFVSPAEERTHVFVSERAREWLEENAKEWIKFEPATLSAAA